MSPKLLVYRKKIDTYEHFEPYMQLSDQLDIEYMRFGCGHSNKTNLNLSRVNTLFHTEYDALLTNSVFISLTIPDTGGGYTLNAALMCLTGK